MGLIIIVVIILFIIANTSHGKKETISFNSPNNTDKIFFQEISGSFYYTSSKNSSLPFVINKNFLTFLQASSSSDSKSNYNNLNIKEKISLIHWLSNNKPLTKETKFITIYYYGLEYRALIENKDKKQILFEVINIANQYKAMYNAFNLIAFLTLELTLKSQNEFSNKEKETLIDFFIRNDSYYKSQHIFVSIIKSLDPNFDYLSYSDLINCFNLKIKEEILISYNLLYFYTKNYILTNLKCNDTSKTYSYKITIPSYQYKNLSVTYYSAFIPYSINEHIFETINFLDSKSKLTPIQILNNSFCTLNSFVEYLTMNKLCENFGFNIKERYYTNDIALIRKILKTLNIEIEILNFNILSKNDIVSIFRNDKFGNINDDISHTYFNALIFIDLGYEIALEDKELIEIEIKTIDDYIDDKFNLTEKEKFKKLIHKKLILKSNKINHTCAISKFSQNAKDSLREQLAKYLIKIAACDGIIKVSELELLKNIFKKLNLSQKYLDTALHKLVHDPNHIVIIEDPLKDKSIILDDIKIKELEKEQNMIYELHSSIFKDEYEDETNENGSDKLPNNKSKMAPISSNIEEEAVPNNFQELIKILITKEIWSKKEFRDTVANYNFVMINNAIDAINDWSDNNYGDFLLEDNDSNITVNFELLNLINFED